MYVLRFINSAVVLKESKYNENSFDTNHYNFLLLFHNIYLLIQYMTSTIIIF